MKRYHWNKKIVLQFLFSLAVCLVSVQCSNWINLAYGDSLNDNDSMRYLWQLCWALSWISLVYCATRLPKLFPNQLKKDIIGGIGWVFKKAGESIHKIYYGIRHALGIPDRPKRIRAKDERSFVFGEDEDEGRRRFKSSGALKWRNLETNAEKIRFIYIKYISKLMKKGYKYNTVLTPLETLKEWKMAKSDSAYMFSLYTDARYSGGRRAISDDEVEKSSKYMKIGAKVE